MASSLKEVDNVQEKGAIDNQVDDSLEDVSKPDDLDKEAEENYMSGIKLYVLIFGLGLAVFVMGLDMTILAVAIPLITEKFQSTADIGWYVSAYLLTLCSFQPLSGKLYSNFSLKVRQYALPEFLNGDTDSIQWTFLTFFLIFEFGSVLSGAATSSPFLIVGRAIAGVGAAGLMSGTLSIVAVVVSMRLRALYTGILSAMFGISTISGPLLGGAFTQHVSCMYSLSIRLVRYRHPELILTLT